ncbi:hypothetical protein CLOM_g16699 [Closterium sp. NIES-68]|nr:hypothetical protein CLOM_g16699 [Closterium sp. NIES-68]
MAPSSPTSLRAPPHLTAIVLLAVLLAASSAGSVATAVVRPLGDPKVPVALAAVETLLRQAQFDVAVGNYDRAARRLFSPVATVSVPGRPLQRLETLAEKAAFLESLAPAPAPSPSAADASADEALSADGLPRGLSPVVAASLIERAELYVPKFDRYLGYSLLTYGRLLQADAQAAQPRTGKFVLLWDLVADNGTAEGGADVESDGAVGNSVYVWGLSWAFWNDDAHRHDIEQLSPARPLPSLPEPERSLTEPLADPHPADLKLQLQEAWAAFSLHLASADVAAAASIFAQNVTLLPPGHPKNNLAGSLEQQEFLQGLVDCHVALDVTVDSLLLVKLKSALTPIVPPPPPAPEALPFQDASSAMLRGNSATDVLDNNEELNNGASNGNPLTVITRSSFILTNSSP